MTGDDCAAPKLLSVVIPSFNRAELVGRAVRSVVEQADHNTEIIVVDDGSDDDSHRRLDAEFGSSVRVIRQEHSGASAARNLGARSATARHVAFLDSDDIALPGWVDSMLNAVGSGIDLHFVGARYVRGDEHVGTEVPAQLSAAFGGHVGLFLAGTFCIDRELFDKAGGYRAGLRYGENTDLGLRVGRVSLAQRVASTSDARALVQITQRVALVDPSVMLESAQVTLSDADSQLRLDRRLWASYLAVGAVAALKLDRKDLARPWLCAAIAAWPFDLRHWARLGYLLWNRKAEVP